MRDALKIQPRYSVSIKQLVVLMHNLLTCQDADADADRTRAELIQSINTTIKIDQDLLESLLYCCNMNHEQGEFWHPENSDFDKFLRFFFSSPYNYFDKDYNQIKQRSTNEVKARATKRD